MAYRGKGLPREGPALLLTTKENDMVTVRFNRLMKYRDKWADHKAPVFTAKPGTVREVSEGLWEYVKKNGFGELVQDEPELTPESEGSEGSEESEESEESEPKPKKKRKAKRRGKGTGPIAKSEVLG